jgi:hypothetical protein
MGWGRKVNKYRSVTGNDFLAFRYELAYNIIDLFENDVKYSAFQPISA